MVQRPSGSVRDCMSEVRLERALARVAIESAISIAAVTIELAADADELHQAFDWLQQLRAQRSTAPTLEARQ